MSFRLCSFDTSTSSVWSSTSVTRDSHRAPAAASIGLRKVNRKLSVCSLRSSVAHAVALDDAAVIDDGDVAAEALRLFQIVRGQDDGGALLVDLAQELPHRAADFDVHAGRGLVQDQQPRLVHQRARDHQPPLHAAGQRARHALALVPQLQLLQVFLGALRARARAPRRRSPPGSPRWSRATRTC